MTEVINLGLIHDLDDEAEALTEALEAADRTSPVRVHRLKSVQGLNNAHEDGECDIIAAVPGIARFDAFKALEAVRSMKAETPVIGLAKADTETTVIEAMQGGLEDLVACDSPEHLLLVIERTLRNRAAPSGATSQRDFTGLFSRLYFLEMLRNSLREEDPEGSPRVLIYVQLDSFGWINESFGIVIGDLFLKSLSKLIADNLGIEDLPARYHGGTFVVLLRDDDLKELEERARDLGEAIAGHVFEHDNEVISSTASIGMALVTRDTKSPSALIDHAFEASENAKADGGNAAYWYGADAAEIGRQDEQEAWIIRIRHAFENDMFTLLFQPIISLRGDKRPRYEVLVRMLNEEGETISPGAFLPFAERAGLMTDIDRWVISHAIYAAQRQVKLGEGPEMFLKLSGKTLIDKNMPAWISHSLKENTCPGEMMVFEITESLAHMHLAQTRTVISQLKQLGCKVGLDHFGTNAGSLNSLDRLGVDYVKIDGSLIRGLDKSEHHQARVKEIIKKARELEIGIIAESVQSASSLPHLWQSGVELIQGYFLQQPSPDMNFDFSEVMF
ncbi:MAG: EAL domain-containing protein [Xanthomonadales bacterium]|nr:EAL domain-containing protein [Xanthomonadales bacterium]